ERGTYTWADVIDNQEGTLSGDLTVDKSTAVTFYYRVTEADYAMLNTLEHPDDFLVEKETIPAEHIYISGHDTITTKGGTLQLSAEVQPEDATNKSIVWSLDNETGSATIDQSGL